MSSLYQPRLDRNNRNLLWLQPFLQAPGLPFASVLSEEDVDAAMAAEGVEFGQLDGSVYTPALTTWAWLSQVLHTGLMRSCAAAVSRIIVLLVAMGCDPCAEDSSAYCRARQKLPEAVIRRLAVEVGQKLEAQVPADWLWHGRHVKLADGTTLTMPDTDANRAAYPQNPVQKPGLGFPILRMVVLLSLATGLLCDMAVGPYAGKETGENALLRTLWDALQPGDILLGDRLYCAYCQVALAQKHHVDCVVRLHQGRRPDFRRGLCLARGDRVVEWQRPTRPEWMDEANCRDRSASAVRCRRSPPRGTDSATPRHPLWENWLWCNSKSSPAITSATARAAWSRGRSNVVESLDGCSHSRVRKRDKSSWRRVAKAAERGHSSTARTGAAHQLMDHREVLAPPAMGPTSRSVRALSEKLVIWPITCSRAIAPYWVIWYE
jgi:hypothetical protein